MSTQIGSQVTGTELRQPEALSQSAGRYSPEEVRAAFDDFVGETFFAQMLKSMRTTVGKPAYFHGGRGEEVFTAQLDQVLAETLSERSAHSFTGPMFDQQFPRLAASGDSQDGNKSSLDAPTAWDRLAQLPAK